VEWGKGGRSSLAPEPEHQVARQCSLEDLVQATKNFSDANIVGAGSFGLVYMGLLLDGTVVAIKRRVGAATQVFADEVTMSGQNMIPGALLCILGLKLRKMLNDCTVILALFLNCICHNCFGICVKC